MQSFADACIRDELAIQQPVTSADAALFLNMNTPADFLAAAR
jgi:hypothetical protein